MKVNCPELGYAWICIANNVNSVTATENERDSYCKRRAPNTNSVTKHCVTPCEPTSVTTSVTQAMP